MVSLDAWWHADGRLEVFTHDGSTATGRDPVSLAKECQEREAGEILMSLAKECQEGGPVRS